VTNLPVRSSSDYPEPECSVATDGGNADLSELGHTEPFGFRTLG
jgi:hypothetical protein